ncbi:MAG: DegQ family serine endoprotease [Pseudomonadales bacterium]
MPTQLSQRIGRKGMRMWSVVLLAMISMVVFAQWPAQLPTTEGRPTLSPLLKKVTPAVVNVSVKGSTNRRNNPLYNDPFFRRFFNVPEQTPSRPRQSVGSGVIIDAGEGYVLTNHHVINNANEITVTLSDGRDFIAELIGSDKGTDVALLQVDADNLNELTLGDSDSVEVGDFVVAIGNPFGLGQTVTLGIVSALGRSGLNIDYEDFIQTDASINPGNSGGALIDFNGNLIGINTAIIAPSGGNVGIGFAIPAKIAKGIVSQLVEFGGVKRGVLGVMITTVTPALAEALDLDVENGALINQVVEDSAAEAAGLHAGDVVIAVDGTPIDSAGDLRNRIGMKRVGDDVDLKIIRDGEQKSIDAKVGEPGATMLAGGTKIEKLKGAEFTNIPPEHPQHGQVDGVLVTTVESGSRAARSGLRQNDIVQTVNNRNIGSVNDLANVLDNVGATVVLKIRRGSSTVIIAIQ